MGPYDYEKDLNNRIEEDEDNANWVHADDDYNYASDLLHNDDDDDDD